ncbi:MAG: hypothetical protein WAK11_07905 [Candidatus Cybelea sp.]
MRFSQRILIAAAATALVVSATPAIAHINTMNMFAPASHSYSGAWPVTVTHSQFGDGTDCLTLMQGSGNAGSASLVAGGQKYPDGSFLVRKDILVVTITEPLSGQNGALLFIAHANNGRIGEGIFENVRGGSDFDRGTLAFGMKGGC